MPRLTVSTLKREYEDLGNFVNSNILTGKKALLQKNYGKEQDCTITSLAFMYGIDNYSMIERIAEKYFYNGDKGGTNPALIGSIMRKTMKQLKVDGNIHSRYLKGVGFNYDTLKRIINDGNYALLNLWKDGRDYYANHTVTIIGWEEYENHRFIVVYDNWNVCRCYIDYDKLSCISSINWYEVTNERQDTQNR